MCEIVILFAYMKKEELQDLKKSLDKRNYYNTTDVSKVFLWCLILPLVIGLVFTYISFAITQESTVDALFDVEKNLWFCILASLLTEMVFFGVFFAYNKMNRIKNYSCNLSFKKAKLSTASICVFLGIFCVLGFVTLIQGCFGNFFDWIGVKSDGFSLPNNTIGWLFVNILLLAIVPAICEELIFRGIIFQGLKEKFSITSSVLLSALLFAFMHQNILQFIYPFILGCILAIVMQKTNNLLYTIIIHFFNNLSSVVLDFLICIDVLKLPFAMMPWWGYVLGVVVALVALAVLFAVYKLHFSKKEKLEIEKTGEAIQAPSICVGKMPVLLIFSMLLSVILIVINAI